jgi:multidrug efflux pump subunit AcrB
MEYAIDVADACRLEGICAVAVTAGYMRPEPRAEFYRHIDAVYTRLLRWSMAHRAVVVGICAIVIATSYPLFRMSGVNFVPDEDESRFQISARLPVDSSLALTQSLLDRIARDMRDRVPGVSDTLARPDSGNGVNAGTIVRLVPIDELSGVAATVAPSRESRSRRIARKR